MATGELETSTPQGEIRIGPLIYGAAMNCLVVPRDGNWYFKQFISTEEVEQFAAEYNLTIVEE